jgi:hypothetical protein
MRRRTSQDGYDAADGIALTGAFEPFEPKKHSLLAVRRQEPEKRFLARRIEELKNSPSRLSIFAAPGDYRMNDPARKAELLAPT